MVRITLAACAVAAIFISRHFQHEHKNPPAADTPAVTQTAVPKARFRTWTLGPLTFTPCQLTHPHTGMRAQAWCAPFVVPENRADPKGRKIHLKLAMVHSDAAVPDKDIVVLLAGGPGQAATRVYAIYSQSFGELHKHHDILLLDQRGTGGSNPLNCPNTLKQSGKKAPKVLNGQDMQVMKVLLKSCLAEVEKKADPRFYTTTDAVADLEAVRQALGAPKLDLFGVSYGTRVAQQYAMHYPDAVRAMVLNSALPNTVAVGQFSSKHLDQALHEDFALCTANQACRKRFGDPYQTLMNLKARLAADPQQVTLRNPQTYKPVELTFDVDSLIKAVDMAAYFPSTLALLPLDIDAASKGNPDPLLGQTVGFQPDIDIGMSLSVTCSEDADLLHARPQDANTLMSNRFIRIRKAQCAIWPHGTRPADFHQPLTGDIPTLVLSGQLDPVTPPSWGRQIVSHLSDARQLVLKGQGHSDFTAGCATRVIRRFFDHPDPKTLDTRCLKRLKAKPFFLDANGAQS